MKGKFDPWDIPFAVILGLLGFSIVYVLLRFWP